MARGRKTALAVELSKEEKAELELWQRSPTMRSGIVRRGRVILLLAQRTSISEIARQVGMARPHVMKWIIRFIKDRMDGLADKKRRGRKPVFSPGGGGARRQTGVRTAR